MVAVEAKGDVMRHGRPGPLLEACRVQDKQKRSFSRGVENNGKKDAVVFGRAAWARHKDRLAGIAAVLMPGVRPDSSVGTDFDLGDIVDEIAGNGLPGAPHEPVSATGAARIVDARQFDGRWAQRLVCGFNGITGFCPD